MDNSSPHHFEMNQHGLWRIESCNFHRGGQIEWNLSYRLRHLCSGKYICIQKVQNPVTLKHSYEIGLTNVRDKKSLFCFVKIENLISKFKNKINVNLDAYFRLQHIETKQFLGIDEEEIKMQCIYQNSSYIKIKIYPFLKDINTFKIKKANFYDIWETNFLNSSITPIIDLTLSVIDVGRSH